MGAKVLFKKIQRDMSAEEMYRKNREKKTGLCYRWYPCPKHSAGTSKPSPVSSGLRVVPLQRLINAQEFNISS